MGKGWVNWGDWLGTGNVANTLRVFQPFKRAHAFARSLKLKSEAKWRSYCENKLPGKPKKPDDIPIYPGDIYHGKGWVGIGDWLGTGTIPPRLRTFRPFKQAHAFARRLKLKSGTEWRAYCKGQLKGKPKKPDDIPANPDKYYRGEGWVSRGDWLGTGRIADHLRIYRPFKQARGFVRALKLKSGDEWKAYCKGQLRGKTKKPDDIPAHPERTYCSKGWNRMGDWLGTGTIAPGLRVYRSFIQARAFVHRLKLKTGDEWKTYCKGLLEGKPRKPHDIPIASDQVYRDKGWRGMKDWLGTEKRIFSKRKNRNQSKEL